MSMNINVTAAARNIYLANGAAERQNAIDTYWKVLEDELMADPINGWVELEDPIDALYAAVEDEDPKERVSEYLNDYIRFHHLLWKAGWKKDRMDFELIEKAKAYIQ